MDRAEFHALYERHSRDVLRFAYYLCGDRALAEDVAADAFATAWASVDEVRTSTVKGYLFAIVRNLVRQSFRKSARSEVIDPLVPDPGAGPASAAGKRLELRAVLEALRRLPDDDRAALLMRAQDGMSHEEIARVLGMSTVAVRVRIHRARLKLGELMIRQERRP